MRKKFEQQYSVDIIPISEVKIPNYKRDELPPVLMGLQYIFTNPEINKEVFLILEHEVLSRKKKTGRIGMDLWQVLVLGVVRMALGANYDRLWDLANHHKLIRQMMGIESTDGFKEVHIIPYTTIRDNASLLSDATIEKINTLVVKAGHQIVKKKEKKLNVKADTYVIESNVHFPTDINLLWDAGRKCIDVIMNFEREFNFSGWRKAKLWYSSLKKQCRNLSKVCQSGGQNKELNVKAEAKEYLRLARTLQDKVVKSKATFLNCLTGIKEQLRMIQLDYFHGMLVKHIDLVERRLIKGETIPHEEKIFSIFEPYTEWIKKGKAYNKVELGLKHLVASDQFGFILTHKVIEKQADVDLPIALADKLFSLYTEKAFDSISFDKGFWNKNNKELLQLFFKKVIMPKKGNKNQAEQAEELSKWFKKLRNKHSAVESNINSLEHHGLNRCLDKGKRNFIKYAAKGVLAYNMHLLGMVLINQEEKRQQKEQKRKNQKRKAA